MLDASLLAIAFLCALAFAYLSSLKTVWLLAPINQEHPVPENVGESIRFRFANFVEFKKDSTMYKPRILLSMMLFVLAALLLKLILAPQGDWTFFMSTLGAIIFVLAFYIGGYINSLAFLVMTVIPGGLVVWFDGNPQLVGVAAGILVGSLAGIIMSRNYRRLVLTTKKELEEEVTLKGKPLSKAGKTYRKWYGIFLKLVPWMMLYEATSFWWQTIDLGEMAQNASIFFLGRYFLVLVSLGIGLNLVLFTVPLFREMLESTNLNSAADFTQAVREWEALPEHEKEAKLIRTDYKYLLDEHPEHTLESFLGKKGQWLSFQKEQIFNLFVVIMYLIINFVGQIIGKGLHAGLISGTSKLGGFNLFEMVQIIEGMTFCASAMFVICMIAALPKDEDEEADEEDPEDGIDFDMSGIDALWLAIRNPELEVTCRYLTDGGEPFVEVYTGEEEVPESEEDAEEEPQEASKE